MLDALFESEKFSFSLQLIIGSRLINSIENDSISYRGNYVLISKAGLYQYYRRDEGKEVKEDSYFSFD